MRILSALLICAVLPACVLGSLTALDPLMMRQALTTVWQKTLNTNADPADGKWYTNGPNNDNVGLYGGLTDTVDTTIHPDTSRKTFTINSFVADSATVNNTDGKNPSNVITLSYSHSTKTSQSHTVSHSWSEKFNISFHATFSVFGIDGDLSTQYSFDYSYSASQSSSESSTDSVTTSQKVNANVPAGKIYKVYLTASAQQLVVPTTAYLHLTGTTETWFNSRVQGHYNWMLEAGAAFEAINKYGASGSDSSSFSSDPSNSANGLYTTQGVITGADVANFQSSVVDVTGLSAEEIKAFETDVSKFPSDRVVEQFFVKEGSL